MINFIKKLLLLTNKKRKSYILIFVIVNYLIEIIYYKLVKIIINVLGLIKIIINIIVSMTVFLTLLSPTGFFFHLKVLFITMLLLCYQMKTFYSFSLRDGR